MMCNHSQSGVESVHWKVGSILHVGFKNVAYLDKNFSLPLILLRTFRAVVSQFKLQSRKQPRYLTQLYCLIRWSCWGFTPSKKN